MSGIEISIVVPVYNSEECVIALYEAVEKAFANFSSYELILVNDKSHDKSWDKIVQVCSKSPKVKGISLRKNFGQDSAILAGLRIASGNYIVIMDDDLQHPPAEIFKLYEECKKGYDVCFALFNEKKQKAWKNIGSWLNGRLSEKLLHKPREIYLSPFKIIKREVVKEMIKFPGSYPYIDATLLTVTSNLAQVEVEHQKRYRGRGNYSLGRSFLVFLNHATNYSIYPLRLVTMAGFGTAIIAFIIGAFYLIQYFCGGHHVEGWITIIILLIFFGGVILLCLGLIGEYVGRTFMSVNNKPQYVIDKVINPDKQA